MPEHDPETLLVVQPHRETLQNLPHRTHPPPNRHHARNQGNNPVKSFRNLPILVQFNTIAILIAVLFGIIVFILSPG